MQADIWLQLLRDASLGNVNRGIEPWPVGRLSELTITRTATETRLTSTYTPTELSNSSVHFVIIEFSTLQHAMTALGSRKHEGSWLEWPRGFPNQNDYESMVECLGNESRGVVLWVQKGADEDKYYLVEMSAQSQSARGTGEGLSALKDYADGLWGVVDLARE